MLNIALWICGGIVTIIAVTLALLVPFALILSSKADAANEIAEEEWRQELASRGMIGHERG
jgi:hypothetical protein